MMISIFIYINFSKNYSKTKPFAKFTLPSLDTTKEVLKLGLPIGLGIFIGKTLLERNKAKVICRNSKTRAGAEVIISWKNSSLKNV